jgi:hypothetical protein
VSVRSVDHGANALIKAMKAIQGTTLRVGVLQGDASHGETTVGDIAEYQEFGTEDIPARSFIRAWYDESLTKNRAAMRVVLRQVTRGTITIQQAFGQLGSLFVAEIQKRIVERIPPPLKDSTVKAKGSDVPLIDTGQLRASITFEVD